MSIRRRRVMWKSWSALLNCSTTFKSILLQALVNQNHWKAIIKVSGLAVSLMNIVWFIPLAVEKSISICILWSLITNNESNKQLSPAMWVWQGRVVYFSEPIKVQELDKEKRNEILLAALDLGAGLRQLSRLTGVTYGVIHRLSCTRQTDQKWSENRPLICLSSWEFFSWNIL